MTKEQEDFVKELKANAVFQLSLSSKELFHSNFLAWLAEDDATRGVFNELLHSCFGVDWDFNPNTMMVKREYKNFDLCICQKTKNTNKEKVENNLEEEDVPGDVLFVLENKFKSIPYQEQLAEYQKKVQKLNKETNVKTNYVLLCLTESYTSDCNWKLIYYSQYIEYLDRANKSQQITPFYQELITQYCNFVRSFADYIKKILKKEICYQNAILPTASWSSLLNHQEFYAIRCYDIWQKLMMQHCASILLRMIKEELGEEKEVVMAHSDKDILQMEGTESQSKNKNKFFIMVNFFHGEALLELKYLIPEKGILTFQQQGNHPLRIGIVATNTNHGINQTTKKKDIAAWKNRVRKHLELCGLDNYPAFQKELEKEENSFNSYGSFYYFNIESDVMPILETLEYMKNKMNKIVAHLKNGSLDAASI